MPKQNRDWFNTSTIANPLERQQAKLFQIMLIILFGGSVLGLLIGLIAQSSNGLPWLQIGAYLILMLCNGSAFLLLRQGRFVGSVYLAAIALVVVIGFSLFSTGLNSSEGVLIAFIVPITLAGLLIGRRGVLLTFILSTLFVIATALFTLFVPALIGFGDITGRTPFTTTLTFILIAGVISLFIDRFGDSLRYALLRAQNREQELAQLSESLETTVAERTAALQGALEAGEQRELRLSAALQELRASQATIREMSAPVIPVLPGVLIAPIVGALDSSRAELLTDNLLTVIERERAEHVIFDLTGVPLIDTQVAHALLQTTAASRLLGAQVWMVGIRAEIAQTIVALGVDFSTIIAYADLQDAIAALMAMRSSQANLEHPIDAYKTA